VKDCLLESAGGKQLHSVFFPLGLVELAADDSRDFDLLLGSPYMLSSAIIYHLPEGLTMPVLPQSTELENDYLAYSLTYARGEGNSIRVNRDLSVKAPRVPARDYEVFKELCREAERAESRLIQLSRKR